MHFLRALKIYSIVLSKVFEKKNGTVLSRFPSRLLV